MAGLFRIDKTRCRGMSRIDCCTEPRENGGKRQRTKKRKKAVLRSNGSPCPARLLSSRQPPVCRFLSLLAGPGQVKNEKPPNGMLLAPFLQDFDSWLAKRRPSSWKTEGRIMQIRKGGCRAPFWRNWAAEWRKSGPAAGKQNASSSWS